MKNVPRISRPSAAALCGRAVFVSIALLLSACGSSSSTASDSVAESVAPVSEATTGSTATTDSTATPAENTTAAAADAPAAGSVDGEWKIAEGSEAGYRVAEVLQGQKAEAVGRTMTITGSMTIAGTKATAGEFVFDLTQLKRDGQVQTRIMQTAQFPTATFKLTGPVDFGQVPAEKQTVTAKALGDLTLHGVTKPVEVELQARMNGANVEVLGSLPVTFADWGIENPSIKPFVEVGETGTIEWLLVMAK
jgi:polyisoprenoid-binding protein YceI